MHRTLGCLVIAMAATSGCSDGAPVPPTSDAPPAPNTVTISMSEWRFGPAALRLEAGTQATIALRNDGAIVHEWALLHEAIESENAFQDELVIAGRSVNAAAIGTITFTVPAAGDYLFICPIPGHFSQGMFGTITATP